KTNCGESHLAPRMFLREDRKPFDAGDYAGIELRVRGRGDGYYVHLRSTRTVFPWSYYAQKVPVGEEWTVVRLPFGAFAGENMLSKTPDVRRLLSVAVVAAKKEFAADLYVDTIALYR
ncbi:MAG: CIA30 family protein, partial [Anaerolineae bacterium]